MPRGELCIVRESVCCLTEIQVAHLRPRPPWVTCRSRHPCVRVTIDHSFAFAAHALRLCSLDLLGKGMSDGRSAVTSEARA